MRCMFEPQREAQYILRKHFEEPIGEGIRVPRQILTTVVR